MKDNLTIEYPPDFLAVWDGCSHLDCLPQCRIGLESGYCERIERAFREYQEAKVTEYSIYEIWQNGTRVASCCGPDGTARKEADHYAMVYGQDGPVEIKKRRQRGLAAPAHS